MTSSEYFYEALTVQSKMFIVSVTWYSTLKGFNIRSSVHECDKPKLDNAHIS